MLNARWIYLFHDEPYVREHEEMREREREGWWKREKERRMSERPIPSSKINELDNQLLFFFLLCDGNGNHVLSWHPRWSTICMQIGAELNPPSNWQIVNRGWEFGDGFSLSTLPVDALHRYRGYVSYFHRTRKNSCPNINWTASRKNSRESPAKMCESYPPEKVIALSKLSFKTAKDRQIW